MNLTATVALVKRWGPLVVVLVSLLSAWVVVTHATAEIAKARQALAEEREAITTATSNFRQHATAATSASTARWTRTLTAQKESHDRITNELRQALADSDFRATALSADIARLHDRSARGDGASAAATGASGAAAGRAEAADAYSVADLIATAHENYGICHRNAAQLVELQAWYEDLRAGSLVSGK